MPGEDARGVAKELGCGDAGELSGEGEVEVIEESTNVLGLGQVFEIQSALEGSGEQGDGLSAVLGRTPKAQEVDR